MNRWLKVTAVLLALMTGLTVAKAQATSTPPAAATSGINGKWHFVLETPGGDREMDADFTVDADGKISGTWGKETAAGTFKDGKLDLGFQMTSEEANETAQMHITGILNDTGAITGNWQFSSYDGSFKAMRPKS